ncbi:SDR family oxidoreductase [Phanerochaete sordida]|uniref:SDR family oxidoreductase n=1 Tax=Phanerochaete sordida TaxID=48140 RepID=A0A9P3GCT6_9APHY|nr:SDR family oxidoreductase [Phanerochaete sordida]
MVKYVLTGATGQLGSRVFKNLIKLVPASDVIVSLHNPDGATPEILSSGVEVRKGDFTQPETLDGAFAGGDKLLIVSYPSIAYDIRVNSHRAAIDAAKRAGVAHVYYTSLMFAGDSQAAVMQAHLATEKYLKESGLTYTIIREGIYSESYPLYFGYWKPGRPGNEVKVPHGDGGIAWVCRDDLGEGTAKLMVSDSHKHETVLFTGSRAITLSELAGIISDVAKIEPPLQLKVVPEDEYVASNEGGEDLLRKWASTYPAVARGELAVVDPLLRQILGRDLKTFEETLNEELSISSSSDAAVQRYSK